MRLLSIVRDNSAFLKHIGDGVLNNAGNNVQLSFECVMWQTLIRLLMRFTDVSLYRNFEELVSCVISSASVKYFFSFF